MTSRPDGPPDPGPPGLIEIGQDYPRRKPGPFGSPLPAFLRPHVAPAPEERSSFPDAGRDAAIGFVVIAAFMIGFYGLVFFVLFQHGKH